MAQRLFVTIHNGPSSNRQQDPKVRSNPQGTPRHHDGLRINVHSEPYQPIQFFILPNPSSGEISL